MLEPEKSGKKQEMKGNMAHIVVQRLWAGLTLQKPAGDFRGTVSELWETNSQA